MKRILIAIVCSVVAANAFSATKLDSIQNLGQSQFRLLSEDAGAVLVYRSVSPAEPLGVTGIDLGIEVTSTKLSNTGVWNIATGDSVSSTFFMPKLHIAKGLPFGFDIGAVYGAVPSSNVKYYGAEVKYAFLKGSTATPAISGRITYSALSGVNQLDFNTTGFEFCVSKGFVLATPYAGLGWARSNSSPQAEAKAVGLQDYSFTQSRYFVGVNLNFGITNFAFEGDKTGDDTSYSAKVGFRF